MLFRLCEKITNRDQNRSSTSINTNTHRSGGDDLAQAHVVQRQLLAAAPELLHRQRAVHFLQAARQSAAKQEQMVNINGEHGDNGM